MGIAPVFRRVQAGSGILPRPLHDRPPSRTVFCPGSRDVSKRVRKMRRTRTHSFVPLLFSIESSKVSHQSLFVIIVGVGAKVAPLTHALRECDSCTTCRFGVLPRHATSRDTRP